MGLLGLGIRLALRASRTPQPPATQTIIVTQPARTPYHRLTEEEPAQGTSSGGGPPRPQQLPGSSSQADAPSSPPPPYPGLNPDQFGQYPYNPNNVPMVQVVSPAIVCQPTQGTPLPSGCFVATLIFSILSFFFVWPLGLAAIILAANAMSSNRAGRVSQARNQRNIAIALLSVSFAVFVIGLAIILSIGIGSAETSSYNYGNYGSDVFHTVRTTTSYWWETASPSTRVHSRWDSWFSTKKPQWWEKTTTESPRWWEKTTERTRWWEKTTEKRRWWEKTTEKPRWWESTTQMMEDKGM